MNERKIIESRMEFRMVEAHLKRIIDIYNFPTNDEYGYVKNMENKFNEFCAWFWSEDE